MKEEITIKDAKEIIEEITSQERIKSSLDINLTPVTIIEYYKTDTFKKKLKLIKNPIAIFMNFMIPYAYRGWYDNKEKNIIIILNHYSKENNSIKYNSLIEAIFTTYHEIQHFYQEKYPQNYYYSFLIEIEKYIIEENNIYYEHHHDKFLSEIDANLWGITKAIEYLKKYHLYYQNNKDYLEKMESKYLFDLKTYNEQTIFEEFHKIMKKDYKKILSGYKILNFFYQEDGKFKNLSEILSNTKEYNINPKITELIISSKSFIKQLDFKNLTEYEKEYMITLLENLYQQEIKKQEIIYQNYEKEKNKLKEQLYCSKNYLEKIKWLAIILDKLIDIQAEKLERIPQTLYHNRIPTILSNELSENNKKRSYNKLPKIP